MIFITLRIAVFAVFLMAGYMLGSKYDSQVIGAVWGAAAGALTLLQKPYLKNFNRGGNWRNIRPVSRPFIRKSPAFTSENNCSGLCDNRISSECIIWVYGIADRAKTG